MGIPDITFTRRTMLTDAKRNAIVSRMTMFYEALASELKTDPHTVDVALTRLATIASQAQLWDTALDSVLPLPSDDADVMRAKACRWLSDLNPTWVENWQRIIGKLNATWDDPATSPIPLSEDALPNS